MPKRSPQKILSLFGLFVWVWFVGGCSSGRDPQFESVAYCYKPAGAPPQNPKIWQREERVPFLDHMPKGARALGTFNAYGADSMTFLQEAMAYHAKKVGADAVVILKERRHANREFTPSGWAETKKTIFPSESDWKQYREDMDRYKKGMRNTRPCLPASREEKESKFAESHWITHSETAMVEAVFISVPTDYKKPAF
jgi:hypothetical protein